MCGIEVASCGHSVQLFIKLSEIQLTFLEIPLPKLLYISVCNIKVFCILISSATEIIVLNNYYMILLWTVLCWNDSVTIALHHYLHTSHHRT